ncbi:MAG: class II fructose-bisphosphate aldolase, partial [Planctomycetota bacterium]
APSDAPDITLSGERVRVAESATVDASGLPFFPFPFEPFGAGIIAVDAGELVLESGGQLISVDATGPGGRGGEVQIDATSVMIDGSHHEYDENVRLTKEAVDAAHANGVVVEAELGMLGGIEEDVVGLDAAEYEKNIEKFLTDPEEAKDFYAKTGIDSLAVAIGTSHGAYKFTHESKLAFDRIEGIMKTCPGLPLVMHGSSSVPQEFVELVNKYGGKMPNAKGVPEDQISMAVRNYGVCKVNIDTDLRLAMTAKIREVFSTKPEEFDPRKYLGPAREAITEMVKRKLHVLNSAGKSAEVVAKWEADGKPMPKFYN